MSRIRIATRCAVAALVVGIVAAGMIGGASAQDYRDHRPPPPRHYRHRPPPPPAWGYDQPTYVPAPPPVVYAAPAPPAAIFGLSLNLR
jgi:hypothetical protein